MKQDFNTLQSYVDEMKATSSGNDKKEIIKKYLNNPFVAKALIYENSPFKQYHVTSKNILKHSELYQKLINKESGVEVTDIFEVLDLLDTRTYTGYDAIGIVNFIITKHYPEHKELILNLIDKDLKTRAGASLINKVKPNHIPEFDVALAQKYEPKHCDFTNETWYASRKLDGCRCIVIVDENGKATAWSRQGKQFETLGNVLADVEWMSLEPNTVLDGEICIVDEDGNEDFQSIMKEIRRKDHTIQNPKYIVFDMLTMDEFNSKTSTRTLSQRESDLWDTLFVSPDTIEVLEQEVVHNEDDFHKWQKMASDGDWEGFMLRRDCEYEGKRSKNLLKVKTFFDDEYKVIDCSFAPFRFVEDGREQEEVVLSNIIIEHKGYKVQVGSGFSLDQRKHYMKNPKEIIGKTVTVQYFEETHNQEGGISLRFPTVKTIYENGRDC
jgi:DNA ligase-1